jgi:hypothetical protein
MSRPPEIVRPESQPDSGLGIFASQATEAPGAPIRKGLAGIGALAVIIAGTSILLSGMIVAAFVGFLWLAFSPSPIDAYRFAEVDCATVRDAVEISAVVTQGPDFDERLSFIRYEWDPQTQAPQDLSERFEIGATVTFVVARHLTDDLRGLTLYMSTGEPGFMQSMPVSVEVAGESCTAVIGGPSRG